MANWQLTNDHKWEKLTVVVSRSYVCGYCGNLIAPNVGWSVEYNPSVVLICPNCNGPTFFDTFGRQWPGAIEGASIAYLPKDVATVYEEARRSMVTTAYTGCVMLCRNLLMHVAVEKGAPSNAGFTIYVKWQIEEHYVPRGSEQWLTYVKDRGNDANHELVPMGKADATGVLRFTEALLRGVYELPNLDP